MTLPFAAIAASRVKDVSVTETPSSGVTGTDAGDVVLTFSNVQFGTAYAGRLIIACVSVGSDGNSPGSLSVSSATIGGVSASTAGIAYAETDGATASIIIYATVPTGTSGTVVVTLSADPGSGQGQACTAYAVDGRTLFSTTPTFTGTAITTSSQNLTVSNVPFVPGGFVLASFVYSSSLNTGSVTNLTKDSHTAFDSNSRSIVTESIVHTSASVTQSVVATASLGGSRRAMVVACWR